eukprot:GHVS01009549.1.p1 GENE.GHVS01009549.1~~GHVS01009549.1.p1  ORF type:complete len:151 (+),score=19.56 GHVS01009549.1:3-455(+)
MVFWLSGFHVPESLITALVQTTCRAKQWPLDKSCLYTKVTEFIHKEQVTERLPHGTYIEGIYLEGAKWERGALARQDPKQLVVEMPLIQLVPVEAHQLKLRDIITTPVYVTQNRRTAMGEGWIFDASLPSSVHPSLWILQGVALVMNTDV